ncbi:MAG TPA: GNAT family N-acetyltransferase [Gemmatirosa sp.]
MTPPPALVDDSTARIARVRRARPSDVAGISALVTSWAAEGLLLPRGETEIAAALDDYLVAVDAAGRVLACAAVREYAPSLAEIVSVAVARWAHGGGIGARVVAAAEGLARVRGHREVFAHTRNPEFFTAIGYECVDRGLYPEKRGRPQCTCVRRAFTRAFTRARRAATTDGMLQAA